MCLGLFLLSGSVVIAFAQCHTDLVLRFFYALISDRVVSSHCFFSASQVLLKLAFVNCRWIRHIISTFSFSWADPPFPPPPGEHLMAEGALDWQIYIILQLLCVQKWIRKKKTMILDS